MISLTRHIACRELGALGLQIPRSPTVRPDWAVAAEIWRARLRSLRTHRHIHVHLIPTIRAQICWAARRTRLRRPRRAPSRLMMTNALGHHLALSRYDRIRRQADRQGVPEAPAFWRHVGMVLIWLPIDNGSVSGLGKMVARGRDRMG